METKAGKERKGRGTVTGHQRRMWTEVRVARHGAGTHVIVKREKEGDLAACRRKRKKVEECERWKR